MEKKFETITIELEDDIYKNLLVVAKENNTTIENILTKYLELCVKEKGLIIWENGFDKPYKVIKDKEIVQKMLMEESNNDIKFSKK